MNLDLFEHSVKTLGSYGYTGVELHTIGDPLANRNLADYLEVLRQHHFIVGKLSSNCLMLDSHLDTLFEYRDVIRSFRASIDAAYKDTYEHIRAGGNWETLLENLHLFKERNAREKLPYPVYINNMISTDNYEELAYIPETFKFLVDPIDVSYVFMNSNAPTDRYFQQANVLESEHTLQKPCERPFGGMHILKDGALTTCCRDYNGDLIYGNIMDDDLIEVLNNDKIRGIREAHLSGDKDKLPKLCQTCFTVDPRWSNVITSLIHVHYAKLGAEPAPLQETLNKIRPMMIGRDYDGIRKLASHLLAPG
jgi:MoaA/NifB/PqqE/SkfB family radical SAM enzyme